MGLRGVGRWERAPRAECLRAYLPQVAELLPDEEMLARMGSLRRSRKLSHSSFDIDGPERTETAAATATPSRELRAHCSWCASTSTHQLIGCVNP